MHHKIPVPLHLQQPLSIDTDINYSLDMSKFPGLDDPQHMYEPALLIAQEPECYGGEGCASSTKEHFRRPLSVHSSFGYTAEATKDPLEELLNIIDACSAELLDRIGTFGHEPNKGFNSSVQDSFGDLSGVPSTKRATLMPTKWFSTNDLNSVEDYCSGASFHPKRKVAGNPHKGYNLSNVSTPFVCSKRKRVEDVLDVPVFKRQCYGMNSPNWFGSSGVHSHNIPVFKEISSNRSFGLSY